MGQPEAGPIEKFEETLDTFSAETKCVKKWYRKNWQKLSSLLSLKGRITPKRLRLRKGYAALTRDSLRKYCGRGHHELMESRDRFSYTNAFDTLFRGCKKRGTCADVLSAV